MVQELIAPLLQEQRKLCFSHGGLLFNAHSPFLSSASTTAASALPSTTLAPSMPEPPLRCPRCDSPNTKFCYYNNYNLTQPRHFCKTCRRYWTKGGALRNIPIGGGCRKTRVGSTVTASCEVGKPVGGGSKSNKFIPSLDNYLFTGLGFEPGAEPKLEYMPQSIVWAPSPPSHPSHLLTLLSAARGDGFQNSVTIKEEAISGGPGMGLDPLGQLVGSQCRNEGQIQYLQQRNEVPRELYQKLPSRAAEEAYCSDHWITSNGWPEPDCAPVAISSAAAGVDGVGGGGGCAGFSAAAAAAFEPETGAEFGCWNPMLSWPDRPTTN